MRKLYAIQVLVTLLALAACDSLAKPDQTAVVLPWEQELISVLSKYERTYDSHLEDLKILAVAINGPENKRHEDNLYVVATKARAFTDSFGLALELLTRIDNQTKRDIARASVLKRMAVALRDFELLILVSSEAAASCENEKLSQSFVALRKDLRDEFRDISEVLEQHIPKTDNR